MPEDLLSKTNDPNVENAATGSNTDVGDLLGLDDGGNSGKSGANSTADRNSPTHKRPDSGLGALIQESIKSSMSGQDSLHNMMRHSVVGIASGVSAGALSALSSEDDGHAATADDANTGTASSKDGQDEKNARDVTTSTSSKKPAGEPSLRRANSDLMGFGDTSDNQDGSSAAAVDADKTPASSKDGQVGGNGGDSTTSSTSSKQLLRHTSSDLMDFGDTEGTCKQDGSEGEDTTDQGAAEQR